MFEEVLFMQINALQIYAGARSNLYSLLNALQTKSASNEK